MASIFDITFSKFINRNLPPDKRFKNIIAYLNCLFSPLQWFQALYLNNYLYGSTAPPYAIGVYQKYDRVIYNKIVYESLINNNTDLPIVATSWMVVQPNFIGIFERLNYNGIILTLTYALNKQFGTIFRQPNSLSDIYIENTPVPQPIFRFGTVEKISSNVSTITSSEYIVNSYSFTTQSNFAIYCPVSVYNALDVTGVNNDKIFRTFCDKYIPAGILYKIITY